MKELTSPNHPALKRLRALKDDKGRAAQGRMLVEGETMVREALDAGLRVSEALLAAGEEARHTALRSRLTAVGALIYLVPPRILAAVCDTVTPQGVAAAFDLPAPLDLARAPARLVALDGVQDPGNLGTIWRTADAAGFQGMICSRACAGLHAPKVQRAAMGSGFRLPACAPSDFQAALAACKAAGYTMICSALDGADFYRRPPLGARYVLVIGSEAHGVSEGVMALCDLRLKLPMRGRAESLNAAVAAGIMMYELTKECNICEI